MWTEFVSGSNMLKLSVVCKDVVCEVTIKKRYFLTQSVICHMLERQHCIQHVRHRLYCKNVFVHSDFF